MAVTCRAKTVRATVVTVRNATKGGQPTHAVNTPTLNILLWVRAYRCSMPTANHASMPVWLSTVHTGGMPTPTRARITCRFIIGAAQPHPAQAITKRSRTTVIPTAHIICAPVSAAKNGFIRATGANCATVEITTISVGNGSPPSAMQTFCCFMLKPSMS